MKLLLNAGTTSYYTRIYLEDSSSSTNAPLTGLTYASSGLKFTYIRDDQTTVTVVTPVTATVGTFTSGGFKEIDAVNFPGLYEIGVPDAALASGKSVQIDIFGATNLKPCPIEIELTAVNLHSATAFVASVPTVVDKAGYALSSTGLDAVDAAEPTVADDGAPSSWGFRQKLLWAFSRLYRPSKTPTALTTRTSGDMVSTVQAITTDGAGTDSVGAAS